jgi:DNA modification methylase
MENEMKEEQGGLVSPARAMDVQAWPIDKLIFYARNPRKNDAAVDRMCGSIREFGFKIPCLVRSDGEVIDGHLRLKAARKLGLGEIPVILCDEWTPAQVKAFRIMVTDPPYGIELDSEWRDKAGLNGCGPAEPSYLKHRSVGHRATSISGDTRADWSAAFALVPSLEVGYVWHASKFTREVLDGLLRIGFLHHQQIIWDKGRTVLTRTHYWFQHEPCWYVRKKNAPWFGRPVENSTIWNSPSPKFIIGGSAEDKVDHPTQKPIELMRKPILNHTKPGELVYEPFLDSGTTLAAAEVTQRLCCGLELDPKYADVVVERWQKLSGKKATLEGDGRTFEAIAQERSQDPLPVAA